jgi:hypothetical protein
MNHSHNLLPNGIYGYYSTYVRLRSKKMPGRLSPAGEEIFSAIDDKSHSHRISATLLTMFNYFISIGCKALFEPFFRVSITMKEMQYKAAK